MEALEKGEICSTLTTKTPEQSQWRRSGVFIVNVEHISHFFLFLLLTMNKHLLEMLARLFILGYFSNQLFFRMSVKDCLWEVQIQVMFFFKYSTNMSHQVIFCNSSIISDFLVVILNLRLGIIKNFVKRGIHRSWFFVNFTKYFLIVFLQSAGGQPFLVGIFTLQFLCKIFNYTHLLLINGLGHNTSCISLLLFLY